MPAEPRISLQTSILLAGSLIALGAYFGLRGRGHEAAPSAPSGDRSSEPRGEPSSPGSSLATKRSTSAIAPAPTTPQAAPDRELAAEAVRRALELQRKSVVEKCVAPALAKQPDPPRVKVTLNMTFSPDGKQLSRGIAEDRETSREGVGACVLGALPSFEAPAQGGSVYVEVPWILTVP